MSELPTLIVPQAYRTEGAVAPFVVVELTDAKGIRGDDLRSALLLETLGKGQGDWAAIRLNISAAVDGALLEPDWCCDGQTIWSATKTATHTVAHVYLGPRATNGALADLVTTASATRQVIPRIAGHYQRNAGTRPTWVAEVYVGGSSSQIILEPKPGFLRSLLDRSAWTTAILAVVAGLSGVAQAGAQAKELLRTPGTWWALAAISLVSWVGAAVVAYSKLESSWRLTGWGRTR